MKKLRGRPPTKRTINLATVNVKRINWRVAVPLILLILVGAALVSKFAVIDRYAAVDAVQREVSQLQEQLQAGQEAIDAYGNLSERYAHYSYAEMTDEEINRVDRTDAIRMMRRVVLPKITVDMWNISGNTLTIAVRANRLQDVNRLAQEMMKEENVEFCTVRSAATMEEREDAGAPPLPDGQGEQVTAIIEAALVKPKQEEGA